VLGRDVDPLVVYPTLEPPSLALPGSQEGDLLLAEARSRSRSGTGSEIDASLAEANQHSAATVLSYVFCSMFFLPFLVRNVSVSLLSIYYCLPALYDTT
jgi:hypothetical protein